MLFCTMTDSARDSEKLEKLYRKYRNLMFYVAKDILHNTQDAEDAVQMAFEAVYKNLDKISQVDSQKTRSFLVIIVERKAIDLLRIRQRSQETVLNEEVLAIVAPEELGLDRAIQRLPANYRNVLLLKYQAGCSGAEIGRLLGISQSGVSKLLGSAKAALRKLLKEEGITL